MSAREKLRLFILENFLFSDEQNALPDDDSLLDMGLIDSTGVLELITFLEDEFRVKVADEEMVPENLDSVSRIVDFVNRKLAAT
jgi:acyl carrier protein